MKREDGPTYKELAEEIVNAAGGLVAVDDLVKEILLRKTVTAKNPQQAVKAKLREFAGWTLVYADKDHVLATSSAYRGARFRIRLNREMVDQGEISMNYFNYFLPRSVPVEQIRLIDSGGTSLPIEIKTNQHMEKSPLFGSYTIELNQIVLKEWFRKQKMYAKDHILVKVIDWEQGIFSLEREAFGMQKPELIKERNQQVADILYQMLEKANIEQLILFIAIPTLYARLPDKEGYPPDHWQYVIGQDERMKNDDILIRYKDSQSLLEKMIASMQPGPTKPAKTAPKPDKKSQQQIYRFRAAFKRKPSIWRVIEIQGKQTLGDLDGELRGSFNHDFSDHLSGFWQLIARGGSGKKKRYREVDLGEIQPFGGGEAERITIAELNLQVGDQLKYVYDFGDWIEHTLSLENISEPQAGVEYPREVESNKPEYQDCIDCKEQGKQSVAIWICHTCSMEQGKEVLLCDNCLEQHEDHYTDEITY